MAADGDDDDDFFGDVDLDHLPVDTLQALEQSAIVHSQRPPTAPAATAQAQVGLQDENDDFDFGDDDVLDLNTGQKGFVVPAAAVPAAAAAAHPPSTHPAKSTLRVDEVTAREQWRAHRYGANATPGSINAPQSALQEPQRQQQSGLEEYAVAPLDVKTLQARIAQLEYEHQILKKDSDTQKQAAMTRAGEIAIVRANTERVAKDYEKRIEEMRLKAQQAEARHKADMDASKRQHEKMATDNKFLQLDLQQESEKARLARRAQQKMDENAARRASPLSTPSKRRPTRPPGFGDGFDVDEIVHSAAAAALTPSRTARGGTEERQSKPGTPSAVAGVKRKRSDLPPEEPPAFYEHPFFHSANGGVNDPAPTAAQLRGWSTSPKTSYHFPITGEFKLPPQNTPSQFAQMILDHQTRTGARFIEVLSRHYLKSKPHVSLASAVYESLKPPPSLVSDDKYRVQVCQSLLQCWAQCFSDKSYEPITDILDLLIYVVCFGPKTLARALVNTAVPLCRQTANLLAVPRHLLAKNAEETVNVTEDMRAHIQTREILHFLHELASFCTHDSLDAAKDFWTVMEHDLVLVMLSKGQPLSQIKLMLTTLLSSITPTSFGTLFNPDKVSDRSLDPAMQQTKMEHDLVSRLIVLLVGLPPRPSLIPDDAVDDEYSSEGNYSPASILSLRSAVLQVLQRLCTTAHGGRLLATHRQLVARLVRFIHDSVSNLYAYNIPTHDQTAAHINSAVLILAHLTNAHADALDLRAKLAVEPGGGFKHLIGLSRVAFAEGASVLEAGITAAAKDAAHRMLDEMLSPEEGEGVMNVFHGRPRARSGASASASASHEAGPDSAAADDAAAAAAAEADQDVDMHDGAD